MIAPAGDDDLFAVTLVSGFAYQFDLLGQGSGSNTLPGATFSLVGTGKTATAGSSGDARISYTASSSGTYYFDVSAGATSTGSYTLSAQPPADDYGDTASTTTGKLAIGGSTTGVIAPAGDDDLFAVTLVSGFAYQFDLLGPGQRQQHVARAPRSAWSEQARPRRPAAAATPGSATRRRPAAPTTSTSRPAPPAPGPIR